jgi:hypothetical protein
MGASTYRRTCKAALLSSNGSARADSTAGNSRATICSLAEGPARDLVRCASNHSCTGAERFQVERELNGERQGLIWLRAMRLTSG